MGLTIFFTVIFVLALLWAWKDAFCEVGSFLATLLSGISTAFCVAGFLITTAVGPSIVAGYYLDKQYIETSYNNPQLTGVEREAIMRLALEDNNQIVKAKMYRDSWFIGAFTYHEVGDLELFDLSKISRSRSLIEVQQWPAEKR